MTRLRAIASKILPWLSRGGGPRPARWRGGASAPTYRVQHLTPAEYLRTRCAGASMVRVEGEGL